LALGVARVVAYRFRRTESVPDGLRRITRERIDKSVQHLQEPAEDLAEGIHAARKRFKEIRAVLRLARPALGDRYVVENRCYRDLGRELAEARDAQAVIETWDKLTERFPATLRTQVGASGRKRLEERRLQLVDSNNGTALPLGRVIDTLVAARNGVSRWDLQGATVREGIMQGLVDSYRRGRRAMAGAYEVRDDEHFHEWRKRIKDQWYHTTLLRPAWHDGLGVRKRSLKALSDCVGDDHDLAVLIGLMQETPGVIGRASFRRKLGRLIDIRREELRNEAYQLGARLYADKPKAFGRRMSVYWSVWRSAANGERKRALDDQ